VTLSTSAPAPVRTRVGSPRATAAGALGRAGTGPAPARGAARALRKAPGAQRPPRAALEPLGGKGGGKPTSAQGQGPGLAQLPQAMQAAEAFARAALG